MQEQLKPETQAKLRKLLLVRNVVGYQKKTVPRLEDDGTTVDEEVIQVIVSEKVPNSALRDDDIIPKEIDGIPINVVDNKGHPRAIEANPAGYYCTKCGYIHSRGAIYDDHFQYKVASAEAVLPNRLNYRPLIAGISIGNYKIKAGTLGWFHEVFCDHPEWSAPSDTRVIQRGKADGGKLVDLIADYAWHQKIYPDTGFIPAPEPTWWQKCLQRWGFWSPPDPVPSGGINKVDFAVAYPYVDIDKTLKTYDFNPIDLGYKLGSKLFAGGGIFTIGCKMSNIEALGFTPLGVDTVDFKFSDQGRKSGRTTGDTQKYCAGDDAVMKVSYGNFIGLYDDVLLFNKMSDGGDSGSAIWKV